MVGLVRRVHAASSGLYHSAPSSSKHWLGPNPVRSSAGWGVGTERGRTPAIPPFHIPLYKGKDLNSVMGHCGAEAPGTGFLMSGSPVLRFNMASADFVPAPWGRGSTSPRFSLVYTKEHASTPGNCHLQTEDVSRIPGSGLG